MTSMGMTAELLVLAGAALAAGVYALRRRAEAQELAASLARAYDLQAQERARYKRREDAMQQAARQQGKELARLRDALRQRDTQIDRLMADNAQLLAGHKQALAGLRQENAQLRETADAQQRQLTEICNIFRYDGSETGQMEVNDDTE